MSKSIKLKNDNYIDSSGVTHNRETLKNILNDYGSYTTASGTYTTASWSAGTNNCIWTAPKTGLYIIWAYFINENNNSKTYKQLQLKGTATRLTGDLLFYQASSQTATVDHTVKGVKASMPIYAEKGQTIIPYIHTDLAGQVWSVSLFAMFIK